MEHQITLNEWLEWKEDIRRKLQETAGNFVHIGYRLKQIRDSGMLDGCTDIFEFALKEYGLGKSTVSRFIAINERFSEGGNSLELRSEYRAIGSSKLAEMLTLTDAECQLITERTTVKEIRELKNFDRQQSYAEETGEEMVYSPLQKCIIDFFSDPKRKDALEDTIALLIEDVSDESQRKAAELINPGEYSAHKKGIIFLFMYDYITGVKYKKMGETLPVSITWAEFLREILEIYRYCIDSEEGVWATFYHVEKEEEKAEETAENQNAEGSVATSQQEEENAEKEEEIEEENDGECSVQSDDTEDDGEDESTEESESEDTDKNSVDTDTGATICPDDEPSPAGTSEGSTVDGEIITPPLNSLRISAENIAADIMDFFIDIHSADEMEVDKLQEIKGKAEELSALLEQVIELKKG